MAKKTSPEAIVFLVILFCSLVVYLSPEQGLTSIEVLLGTTVGAYFGYLKQD